MLLRVEIQKADMYMNTSAYGYQCIWVWNMEWMWMWKCVDARGNTYGKHKQATPSCLNYLCAHMYAGMYSHSTRAYSTHVYIAVHECIHICVQSCMHTQPRSTPWSPRMHVRSMYVYTIHTCHMYINSQKECVYYHNHVYVRYAHTHSHGVPPGVHVYMYACIHACT